eukprot:TRINITY_DN10907_c0_g1_i1.p1 TRINITY_DN10907_c0_g1~~TRINITY_DN10907_c0_g1_i1.p1  ORF type:complete len:401 (+),score=89.07 TRINITY_DN10907_c0_g1_i1:253-1455(+)
MTPVTLLKMALKITSPGHLIEKVLSLFLKKVMGSQNLVQRMYKASSKLAKTENLRQAALDKVESARIRQKLQSYFERKYDPAFREQHPADIEPDPIRRSWLILTDLSLEPKLTPNEIGELTVDDYRNIAELVLQETRLRDKQNVCDFLGDDKAIDIIKRLFPIIHLPLVEVLCTVDLSAFLEIMFSFLGSLIELAEEEKNLPEFDPTVSAPSEQTTKAHNEIAKKYYTVVSGFIDQCYTYLHMIIRNDKGTLEILSNWLFDRLELIRNGSEPLDMEEIIHTAFSAEPVNPTDEPVTVQTLMKEIKELEDYVARKKAFKEKKVKNLLQPIPGETDVDGLQKFNEQLPVNPTPTFKAMPLLLRPFIRQVKGRLFHSGVFRVSFAHSLEKHPIGSSRPRGNSQ